MTNTTSFLLAPFILAFFLFVFRFYSREGAASVKNPSFILAILTVALAGSYLVLGVTDSLPPHAAIGYAALGIVLFAVASIRIFMI